MSGNETNSRLCGVVLMCVKTGTTTSTIAVYRQTRRDSNRVPHCLIEFIIEFLISSSVYLPFRHPVCYSRLARIAQHSVVAGLVCARLHIIEKPNTCIRTIHKHTHTHRTNTSMRLALVFFIDVVACATA